MTVQMILLPLFVQVALTFFVLFLTGARRMRPIRERTVGPEAALDDSCFPPPARQAANNLRNQFEVPVLFYVLTVLVLLTRKADLVFVILAWVFVLSRIVHACVHCTSNDVRLRFSAYGVGALVLLVMWVLYALAILLNV
ncbi:MAPEG family protein [Azorhizobium doebereinerae]|uniref:MAPEG family protein n=1 Tax=Azorhizobium doebereinerae TaxID=281091 RepID=UPI000490BF6E|nr:MAPEG family protein [Azorhizobium doebereinerae]